MEWGCLYQRVYLLVRIPLLLCLERFPYETFSYELAIEMEELLSYLYIRMSIKGFLARF